MEGIGGRVGVGVLLVVIACVAANGMMEGRGRTIVVGDSQGWRVGTNYTDWAIQNSPFRINDTLVFKYGGASRGNGSGGGQSVYLMPNLWSFVTCEFKNAKLLGSGINGSAGQELNYQLKQWRPYYFASADGNGYDCIAGLTKFVALPYHYHPAPPKPNSN